MSASKLKNIALLILLLTNLFLLGQVVIYERRSAEYREAAVADAIAILADSGISVARASIPDGRMPAEQSFTRDYAAEEALAVALLGEIPAPDPGGTASGIYHTEQGTVRFFSDGLMEGTFTPEVLPLGTSTPQQHAVRLLRTLGIDTRVTETSVLNQTTTVTVCQEVDGFPVFSFTIQCVYDGGSLVSLSGRRLSGTPAPVEGNCLDTATLLVRFRNAVQERGDVCSAIVSIEPGYETASSFTGPSRLVPVLFMIIDGNRGYYLNMKTGELKLA